MNSKMAEQLGVSDTIEAIIAGKSKGIWKTTPSETLPLSEVWMNGEELKSKRIADNTIATIRKPK
jgi:hypothetical protein